MSRRRYLIIICLLALLFSMPAFSAVKILNEVGYGFSGLKYGTSSSDVEAENGDSEQSVFNIDEDFEDEEETEEGMGEPQITTPLRTTPVVPLSFSPLLAAPSQTSGEQATNSYVDENADTATCKYTQDLQYPMYNQKNIVTVDGKEDSYYCTCPHFKDDEAAAKQLCRDLIRSYFPGKDDTELDQLNQPTKCYYKNTRSDNKCSDSLEETWGVTYVGCDCSGFKSKEEFCEGYISQSSQALKACVSSLIGSSQVCQTKRYETSSDQVGPGNKSKYLNFRCQSDYYTKEKYWENFGEVLKSNGVDKKTFDNYYVGLGYPCIASIQEGVGSPVAESEYAYKSFGRRCQGEENVNYFQNATSINRSCKVPGYTGISSSIECHPLDLDESIYQEAKYYQCRCPSSFATSCEENYQAVGGAVCTFDFDATDVAVNKYEECKIACETDYAAAYATSESGCNNNKIDSYGAPVRKKNGELETCAVADDPTGRYYICGCPNGFYTKEEWCKREFGTPLDKDGKVVEDEDTEIVSYRETQASKECVRNYVGLGTPCYRDIVWEGDNPISVLTKYISYHRACPSDRPLYYNKEDCGYVGGEYEYSCYDGTLNTRIVCSCPDSYYDEYGNRKTAETENDTCTVQNLAGEGDNELSLKAESSGKYCSLDSKTNLKYEECIVTCNAMLNEFAIDNAYMYLNTTDSTPTPQLCQKEMGSGAVLGYVSENTALSQPYCSLNHELKYPCYCPSDFEECNGPNQIPDPEAKECKAKNKVYYSKCTYAACPEESDTVFVEDAEITDAYGNPQMHSPEMYERRYGRGAKIQRCIQTMSDGSKVNKYQISCDPTVYNSPCDYPYISPLDMNYPGYEENYTDFCLYKDASGEKREHFMSEVCKVRRTLGACGKSILDAEGGELTENEDFVIKTASTENECKEKYGDAVETQLCEDENAKRAYNCYFDKSDYPYTTANCGVRHDLSGKYVMMNGIRYWDSCECVAAYRHHKYNCPGILNGSPCKQNVNSMTLASDSTIPTELRGSVLQMYPYCQCSSDYTKICDEDGSGRYKGVGDSCNGKYKSCQCVPDELPINWTDNYYGCPGGKRPTGVWKDNGCGKKYYQCAEAVNPCTYEHTEQCVSPLQPVGQPCQDNLGNIGGYKSCVCPSGYQICPNGKVGKGEPCNLKGVSWYKECADMKTCTALSTETCKKPLQIGVNPCARDNETFYEKCVCANGYNKVCGEGEVGVGSYCELGNVKYYKECKKPTEITCSSAHQEACDANQESYSPCVDKDAKTGKQTVKYLCRCPANWVTCPSGAKNPQEYCTDSSGTTYYRECDSAGSTECTSYQNIYYKTCTDAQTGIGKSCSTTQTDKDGNEVTITKYVECRDSHSCVENGFKYTCSGYNAADQGDYCVDTNGNKLYKSCACPTSYMLCTTTNASKGLPCTPLYQDGSLGDTVYSSCACDTSRYKYTCAPEGYNLGITTPENPSYCAVKTQKKVTDEDGNTSTVEEDVNYYNYCRCREEYKYTCTNSDYGETIADVFRQDYCLLNATKFYPGCECGSKYKYASDSDCVETYGDCYVVDKTSAFCSRKGISSLEHDENGKPINVEYFNEQEILYSKCKYDVGACNVSNIDDSSSTGTGSNAGNSSGNGIGSNTGSSTGTNTGANTGTESSSIDTTKYASCSAYAQANGNAYSVPMESVNVSVCLKEDSSKYREVNINGVSSRCYLRECMSLV